MHTDNPGKALSDRLTLEKVAASYNELMALQAKQRMTQAQLIRWATQEIDRPRPTGNFGRVNTHRDHLEAVTKWKSNQKLAREGLFWLADKLEGKEVPDLETGS